MEMGGVTNLTLTPPSAIYNSRFYPQWLYMGAVHFAEVTTE